MTINRTMSAAALSVTAAVAAVALAVPAGPLGSSGRHGESRSVMMQKCYFGDTLAAYVAAGDTST